MKVRGGRRRNAKRLHVKNILKNVSDMAILTIDAWQEAVMAVGEAFRDLANAAKAKGDYERQA